MNKRLLGLLVAGSIALSATAMGQTGTADKSGGYAWGSPYNRLYNPKTVVTFYGKVTGVQNMQPLPGMDDGVILLVKTSNGGTALVDVGPAWFVNNQHLAVGLKDRITVTGSKVIANKRGTILAQKIQKGSNVLILRRTDGQPLWWAYQTFTNGVPNDLFPGATELSGTIESMPTVDVNGVTEQNLVLNTANGAVTIDLGPQWFLERQGMALNLGNNITVFTGPSVTRIGNVTLLPAFGVVENNGLLFLRSGSGFPIWEGWNAPKFLIGGGG